MTLDRRSLIGAGFGLGAAATAARATDSPSSPRMDAANASAISPNLVPDDNRDQTAALQAAYRHSGREGHSARPAAGQVHR